MTFLVAGQFFWWSICPSNSVHNQRPLGPSIIYPVQTGRPLSDRTSYPRGYIVFRTQLLFSWSKCLFLLLIYIKTNDVGAQSSDASNRCKLLSSVTNAITPLRSFSEDAFIWINLLYHIMFISVRLYYKHGLGVEIWWTRFTLWLIASIC